MCSSKAAAARRQLLIADIVMYGGGCGEVPGNSASKESRVGDPAPHLCLCGTGSLTRSGGLSHGRFRLKRKPGRRPGSTPAGDLGSRGKPGRRPGTTQSRNKESRVGDPAPHNLETKKAGSETRLYTISKQRMPGRRPGTTQSRNKESRVGDPAPHPASHLYLCGIGPLWDRVFDPVRW